MKDLFVLFAQMASFMLPVLIVLLVVLLAVWVVCCIFYMKFCSACGHAHSGLVWVPVPGIPNIIVLQSMTLTGAVDYNNILIYGVCCGMLACMLLSGIPIIGVVLGIVGWICSIAYLVLMLIGMYKVAALLGKNGVVYVLLAFLLPITQPFLFGSLAKGLNEYAEETYG